MCTLTHMLHVHMYTITPTCNYTTYDLIDAFAVVSMCADVRYSFINTAIKKWLM